MDQRPGENVDLGLYFHGEGPVSQIIRLTFFCDRTNPRFSKKIFESFTKDLVPQHNFSVSASCQQAVVSGLLESCLVQHPYDAQGFLL